MKKIAPTPPTKQTTMRFPRDLHKEIRDQAVKENRTATNLVVTMLWEGLTRRKKKRNIENELTTPQ